MTETCLPLGPVICDVAGLALDESERARLRHPLIGGVILFARNYRDPEQLADLTAEIHALRSPSLIISVDHEGGRVQRFRCGFTRLPAMGVLGQRWLQDREEALRCARDTGFVLATELREKGVDLSFTPVLDLDCGRSEVIGDRGFGADPDVVAILADALAQGLSEAGMGAVGKHFPGHGWAEADSHVAIPRDEREFTTIWEKDIAPYRAEVGARLSGVMPAHVIYPAVDPNPAGFSRFWLQDVLRTRVGFSGVVFSDDLTMEGATVVGDIVARAEAAHSAGCDMVLVCNRPDLVDDLLARWAPKLGADSLNRIAALQATPRPVAAPARLEAARATVRALVGDA